MSKKQPQIQGSALVFRARKHSTRLDAEKVMERTVTLPEYLGCFIENKNLHGLPQGCSRVLLAYSNDWKEKKEWNLGIMINLNLYYTVILPVVYLGNGEFCGNSEVVTFECLNKDDKLTIQYINYIDENIEIAADGNVESSFDGPDVLTEDIIPCQSLIDDARRDLRAKQFYKIKKTTYPISHVRRETETDCFYERLN